MILSRLLAWLSPWRRDDTPPEVEEIDDPIGPALERVEQAKATAPIVERVASDLLFQRKQNHFGETIEAIYRRGNA